MHTHIHTNRQTHHQTYTHAFKMTRTHTDTHINKYIIILSFINLVSFPCFFSYQVPQSMFHFLGFFFLSGAPIYVSMPHFLGADPYYFDLVHGLRPDRSKHQPYFHLHQLTGVCLSASRRYQLVLQVKEYHFLK